MKMKKKKKKKKKKNKKLDESILLWINNVLVIILQIHRLESNALANGLSDYIADSCNAQKYEEYKLKSRDHLQTD